MLIMINSDNKKGGKAWKCQNNFNKATYGSLWPFPTLNSSENRGNLGKIIFKSALLKPTVLTNSFHSTNLFLYGNLIISNRVDKVNS